GVAGEGGGVETVDGKGGRERAPARLWLRRRRCARNRRGGQARNEDERGEARTHGRDHERQSPFAPARNIGSLLGDRNRSAGAPLARKHSLGAERMTRPRRLATRT